MSYLNETWDIVYGIYRQVHLSRPHLNQTSLRINMAERMT